MKRFINAKLQISGITSLCCVWYSARGGSIAFQLQIIGSNHACRVSDPDSLFFQIGCFLWTTMLWRFVRSLDVLKTTRWAAATSSPMSAYRILWTTTLLSSAVLVVIATIIAVARIAYEEQSLVAFVVLLVTIIQVEKIIPIFQFK